ncbi:MAG TPA: pseudouridine synthase [Planctomycetota bacterium]|nr:pseudouridine synthase [Planctomycetota bacterium]HRR79514.1 pseudouridine synthase [Planctomycetota bacterium]HRT96949.1 pseudouridine synthase [Planctomycetota bacterium]
MSLERLNKLLAHAGFGSRRACDELIAQGRVTVNGAPVTDLGHKVDPSEADIRCDGVRVRQEAPAYYLLNKPRGVVCTSDGREGRARAIDLVPGGDHRRLYTIGRLDADSRGLILLTNDGALTQRLTHPSHEVPKLYRVWVRGAMSPEDVEKVQRGVYLSEGRTSLSRVRVCRRRKEATELEVELRQGINRQIRRVLAKVGHPVSDLQRVAIGPIRDPLLKEGACRKLRPSEVRQLEAAAHPPQPRSQRR